MRILVVGAGGREHALAAKLAAEPEVTAVVSAPGNPGMSRLGPNVPLPPTDLPALARLARAERIDLTVVGPELPLERGIVDRFAAEGLRIFGPTQAAAALECSKAFAKSFMARHGVPTARYRVCDDAAGALAVVGRGELGFPVVVKADGLAAGKGVVIAPDEQTARAAVQASMEERRFGDAGSRIVLEECLTGPEVSFFVVSDGTRALTMLSAQDHKRVFDDDRGPNTGGMGAFAPSPLVDAPLQARILREIVEPVIAGMRAEGREYRGFLYVGLMLTGDGPKVIEFNARFGDPEAQVVIPLIDDSLASYLAAAADGALPDRPLRFAAAKQVGVVLASRGYPGPVETEAPIAGIERAERVPGVAVYHAGTTAAAGRLQTAGGRVLTVVGRGETYAQAIERAYEGVALITFAGMQYRKDIGRKAVERPVA